MGNDGGTIARGKDLKALYAGKGTQELHYVQKAHNSKVVTCSLSSLPLYQNGPQKVVSDFQGKVFLKEKVIEFLLRGKDEEENTDSDKATFQHLQRLSDVVDLQVTWKDGAAVCPLTQCSTGLVYLRQCGCVLAAKMAGMFPEQATSRTCAACGHAADALDVVHLNPEKGSEGAKKNSDSYGVLVLQGLTHSKKERKRKREGKRRESAKRKCQSER